MFDCSKIRHLRKLPDGNSIVLIWVMLLAMAGKANAGGMILLTENIPYTVKMIADELDFEETTVLLALNALENFGMIIQDEGIFAIKNWEEYQNQDGLEKMREQHRIRQKRYRDKQKRLIDSVSNVDVTLDVTSRITSRDGIDKELELDKELDNILPPKSPTGEKQKSKIDFESLIIEKGFEPLLEYSIKEWLEYKKQKKDKYTEIGFKKLLTRIEKEVSERGVDRMIADIDMSMENNYKGIVYGLSDKKGFNQGSNKQGRLDWIDDI